MSDNLSVIDSSTCSCGPKRDCEHRAALTLACLQLPEYQNAEKSAQSPQYRDEKKSAQSLQYDDADKSELLPAAEQTCSELAKSATEQTGSEQVQSATELFCPKQGELPSDLSVDEPDAQLNPTAINTLSNRAVKSKQTARSKRRYSKRAVSRMRTTARTISTNHTQAPSRGRVTHSVNSTRFVNSSRSASSPDTNVVSADSILSSALNVRLKALSEALQNHRLDIGQDMQKNCKVPSVTLLGGINPTESRKFILETAENESENRDAIAYILRTKPPLRVEAYCVSNSKEGKCIAKFPVSNNFILDASVDAGNTSIAQEDCDIARLAVEISLQSPTGLADAPAEIVNAYMTKLINTGRLHLQSLDSAPLTRGKMLPGKLSWVLLGHAVKPRLAAIEKDERHSCLPMGDGWYINEEKGCTGRIDFPLPLTILKAFTEGLEFPQIWQSPFDHMVVALGLDCVIDTADAIPNIERRIEKPSVSIDLVWLTQMQKSFKKAVRVIEVMLHFSKKNGEYLHDGTGSYFYNIHDRSAHHSIVERLELLGLQQTNSTNLYGQKQDALYFTFENNIHLAEFVRLHAPQLKMDGWQLRENFSKPLKPVQINDIKISLTKDKAWWYSLYLDIEVEGERVSLLPVLLEVIQLLPPGEEITEEAISDLNQNGLFHALLPGGQLISISFERISNILITLGEMIQNQCRSKRLQISAFEIDDILKIVPEELEQSHEVEGLLDLERRLTRIKQTGDIEPPKMFNAQLRPYQMQGLRWLQCLAEGHFGGILADDMGLGKTVQVLAHITLEKEKNRMAGKPFLVVCPTSVLPNWQAEIRKFAPHLNVFEHYGLDRNQRISNMAHADVVLTTYPLLARDNSLQDIDWHGIALDESQAIKNSTSQIAQAACRLNATHRFCITGTPIENHLGELWSQFQFLLPGYLGTQAEFRSIVRDPIERDAEYIIKRGLSRRIRPFILRRTKDEVAQDLPEKVKMIKVVELAGAQRDLYETVRLSCSAELRTQMLQQGFGRSRISILSTLQKLRQVCCDPRLLERNSIMKEGKSAKLELLMEMLHDVIEEGRKVLVFSQFTSMLDLIAHELEGAEIPFVQLRGDTKDRVTPVREFQEGQTQVFLLSLKAGGSGLNLTAADVVIHYDPWWNPAAEEQATDRAHRIGQKNKVFVYKLIASGTIEERMIAMQEQKRSLARGVLDEQKSNAPLFTFSEEEMWDLVAPLAEISKPAVSFA